MHRSYPQCPRRAAHAGAGEVSDRLSPPIPLRTLVKDLLYCRRPALGSLDPKLAKSGGETRDDTCSMRKSATVFDQNRPDLQSRAVWDCAGLARNLPANAHCGDHRRKLPLAQEYWKHIHILASRRVYAKGQRKSWESFILADLLMRHWATRYRVLAALRSLKSPPCVLPPPPSSMKALASCSTIHISNQPNHLAMAAGFVTLPSGYWFPRPLS